MTYAERAAKRARAIYEAALFSTLMQQESATAAELEDEFDFDVTLRETLVRDGLQGITEGWRVTVGRPGRGSWHHNSAKAGGCVLRGKRG